jgi:hypothetical protein
MSIRAHAQVPVFLDRFNLVYLCCDEASKPTTEDFLDDLVQSNQVPL